MLMSVAVRTRRRGTQALPHGERRLAQPGAATTCARGRPREATWQATVGHQVNAQTRGRTCGQPGQATWHAPVGCPASTRERAGGRVGVPPAGTGGGARLAGTESVCMGRWVRLVFPFSKRFSAQPTGSAPVHLLRARC
jgi:hypothetical protein